MVIQKVMALLRAAVKPEKAGDVYDVDGLCDAIQEVVKKQKQSKPGCRTEHRLEHLY
jgi:hypothetical protein